MCAELSFTRVILTDGYRAENSASSEGRWYVPIEVLAPILTNPVPSSRETITL